MPTDKYLNKIVLNKMTREQFENLDVKNPDEFYAVTDNTILGGNSMFDTILKDHVLTYEESKGLALQGTYVYKDALAGSRYGYPDFYNKCLEEYENDSNTQQYLKSNITKVGALTDNQGVLSGFAPSIYAKADKTIDFNSADSWEINLKLKTGSNYTAFNDFFGVAGWGMALGISTARKFSLAIGTGGSNWSIGSPVGTHTVQDNTDYYVKVKFTGSAYTLEYSLNGEDYSTDITIQSSVKTISGIPNLGLYSNGSNLTGSIDLNESYININGERVWNGVVTTVKNPNGHVFYDISIKDQIDEIFNSTGMAWMYGIDQENERIFLPRNNWFEQATGDISEVGQSVDAGLPNIIGGVRVGGYKKDAIGGYADGALSYSGLGGNSDDFYGGSGNGFTHVDIALNASSSNPIYGNSDTVQPNAVKKLLYICVGNTTNYEGMTDVVNQGMEILEQVNQGIESRVKLDGSNAEFPYITETYQNGTSWYRVYSDGWCEQGGSSSLSSIGWSTVTFLKPFINTNYTFVVSQGTTGRGAVNASIVGSKINNYSAEWTLYNATGTAQWIACGYIA